jgi:hypothetical protein
MTRLVREILTCLLSGRDGAKALHGLLCAWGTTPTKASPPAERLAGEFPKPSSQLHH